MGGSLTPKVVLVVLFIPVIVFTVVALLPLVIAVSWVALLLSYAGFTTWPPPPTKEVLIIYLMVTFSVTCASLGSHRRWKLLS